ncbi:FAD/NAD(P)-binding domain-containing protein [Lepidopterella palustris CBS 459.81]|uniref:FAD/NAD(P)-binding domain-containing protein n=1 Tax=Lepidopterella palustris CBS 459.81 TaxID=1314670 RepID=A0A8E2EGY4_9PEZI|nr:FAD/NAD(P)-binding domain-containing protein [Lepidopterella palustris CBS 459.81]
MTSFLSTYKPIFEPKRTLKVIVIGAGASGLLMAYKLQRHFDNFEVTIYEKNKEPSGTWYENRYPGCACDVPSHCYTWSFEPKTDWSATYATSKEIHEYFCDFMYKYGLDKYIKLQHAVSGAVWNPTTAHWDVVIDDLATGQKIHNSAHVLINATGILNAWRYPPIPGINDYKGALVHSAAWDPNLVLEGKTVGLIGNGSSGIQILPAIKDQVKDLVTFIREPTWIAPPIGQGYKVYSDEERAKFASDPKFHLEMRREIEKGMNSSFAIFHTGSELQKMTRQHMLSEMKEKLHNAELERLLIPEWSVGCRRITPGTNYLESLSAPNVKVVYGEISEITEKGPIVEGTEHPVDVLICATGFDTTFKPRFPLIGKTGQALADLWKDEPRGYFGCAVNDYPNYFMLLGPNCPIGNGPVLISIEAEVEYVIKMLSKFQKENIRSFDVKPEPVAEFNEWKDKFMEGTIWTEECRSWYKAGSAKGKIAALWPGSTLHYLEALKEPRWEDWDFKYQSNNRFEYLGNGHSSAEAREGGDLSYYIRDHDDTPIDIALKKPTHSHPGLEGIVPSKAAIVSSRL